MKLVLLVACGVLWLLLITAYVQAEKTELKQRSEVSNDEVRAARALAIELVENRENDYDNITFKISDSPEWTIVPHITKDVSGFDLYREDVSGSIFTESGPIWTGNLAEGVKKGLLPSSLLDKVSYGISTIASTHEELPEEGPVYEEEGDHEPLKPEEKWWLSNKKVKVVNGIKIEIDSDEIIEGTKTENGNQEMPAETGEGKQAVTGDIQKEEKKVNDDSFIRKILNLFKW